MKLRRRCFSLHRLALIRRVSQLEVVAPPSRSPESITRDPLARLVKQTKLPGKYLASVSFLTHVFLCFVGSTHVVSIGVFSMLHKCLFLSVSSFANTCFFSCFGAPVPKVWKSLDGIFSSTFHRWEAKLLSPGAGNELPRFRRSWKRIWACEMGCEW